MSQTIDIALIIFGAWGLAAVFALALARCAKLNDEECREYYDSMKKQTTAVTNTIIGTKGVTHDGEWKDGSD